MNINETLDEGLQLQTDQKNKRRVYAFTIFGLLDLASFIRGTDLFEQLLSYGARLSFLDLGRGVMIISFLATTILFLLRKRFALIFYFVQFPLRIVFFSLSFTFLLDIFNLPYGSVQFMLVVGIIFILELLRFFYSVLLFRKQ